MSIIPGFGRQKQEDCKFNVNLGCIMKTCAKLPSLREMGVRERKDEEEEKGEDEEETSGHLGTQITSLEPAFLHEYLWQQS
jgi:hypothetical protein